MLFWETVFIASVTGSARKQGFSSLLDLVDPWVTAKYIKLDISDDQVTWNSAPGPQSNREYGRSRVRNQAPETC